MTNTLTIDQLQELLQIQKKFDDRIPTRNLNDTVASMIIEFAEWVNTLEFFKNWKKQPGKPLDTQLDEISCVCCSILSFVVPFHFLFVCVNELIDSVVVVR